VVNIFCLDTSLRNITLAIIRDRTILAQHNSVPESSQSAVIMQAVDAVFKEAKVSVQDINTVLFCSGPGSFTSLRVGLATVQGLFLKSGARLFTTSSLLLRSLALSDMSDVFDRSDRRVCATAPLGRERVAVGFFAERSEDEPRRSLGEGGLSLPQKMPQHLRELFTQRLTSCPLYREGCVRGENLTEMNQLFPDFAAFAPNDVNQTKLEAFLTILEKKWFEETSFEEVKPFYMIEPGVGQKQIAL
jgi:tRNA threonylcarbamoyl adenosine modification protein YeaZ